MPCQHSVGTTQIRVVSAMYPTTMVMKACSVLLYPITQVCFYGSVLPNNTWSSGPQFKANEVCLYGCVLPTNYGVLVLNVAASPK